MSEMYTIDEVADIIKYNPESLRRLAREGKTKFFKFYGEWRITKDDLDLWIQEMKQKYYNEKVS